MKKEIIKWLDDARNKGEYIGQVSEDTLDSVCIDGYVDFEDLINRITKSNKINMRTMKMKIGSYKLTVNRKQFYLTYKNFNYYLYCLYFMRFFFRRGRVSDKTKFYWEPRHYIDFTYVNAQT